ncbi:unknown [Crocosphaera subtropica ATCC 51142]|uniref:Uncharacterized protein n=1 Tax=Crocosphaera subtropica (strain ATCC 51142 / BH68) TaxID=43989 RepID=B1X046_CROS5|nr:alpha/beta hydrolase [Crocosphaera subtropica]ACB49547.1 unknown [Crocosphaera subtropica ATCC 51142]
MTQPKMKQRFNTLVSLGSWLIGTTMVSPAIAAEEIKFYYNNLSQTVKVESLEAFAADGTVKPDLRTIFNLVKPDEAEKAKFQAILLKPFQLNPVLLSRLLNTDEGDRLLTRLGDLIEIQGGTNGKSVLRGSMIQAAAKPKGLTILNFLQTLPTNMQINVRRTLQQAKNADFLVKTTGELVDTTERLSQEESKADPLSVDFSQLPNPGDKGSVSFTRERWDLRDENRERAFYVEVYRPKLPPSAKMPVIVLSHGLGERPETYYETGELLASHGFLVAMPQHPGSDTKHKQALLEGLARDIFSLNEFIDRPLDISYTLDELERRNQQEFGGQLNLTKVGAFGHSFGGYTALAVAGATIDTKHLDKDCASDIGGFNQALLLQCRALKLTQPLPMVKDERIGAVLVYNPVNASIFGPQGLAQVEVPVFVGAGSYDLSTPFIFEQARSFPWLVNAHQSYLLLQQGDSHVNIIKLGAGSYAIATSLLKLTLPDENLRQYYARPSIVAFAQVYVANNQEYLSYLHPSYDAYLSEGQEFKAFLITGKSAPILNQSFPGTK